MATGAEAPAVALGWVIPAAGALGWHEMVLTAEMLGGWTKYRMGDKVRKDLGGGELDGAPQRLHRCVPSSMRARVLTRSSTPSIAEIEWLADSGSDVRLGGEKSRLLAERTLALEDIEHRAGILQTYVARYGNPDSIQAELHEFSVVSRRDIADNVERFLQRGRRVRVDAVPESGAPKAGAWPTIGGRPLSPRRNTWTGVVAAVAMLLTCCGHPHGERRSPDVAIGRGSAVRTFRPMVAPTDPEWLRAVPPSLPMRPAVEPAIAERRLANGSRVLVVERHDFPSVSLAFVLDRGICDGGAAAAIYGRAFGSSPGQ